MIKNFLIVAGWFLFAFLVWAQDKPEPTTPPAGHCILWKSAIGGPMDDKMHVKGDCKGRIVGDFSPTDSKNVITLMDELPADVPAIQQERTRPLADCMSPNCAAFQYTEPTCADQTRVLMHDEQAPPKFWCHRLDTGEN